MPAVSQGNCRGDLERGFSQKAQASKNGCDVYPSMLLPHSSHRISPKDYKMTTNLTEDVLKEPVVRHLRRDFACFLPGQTVAEALEQMRQHPPEGRIIYFYVVDEEQRLQGVVPTRRLLLAPLDRRVEDI